MEGSDFKGTAFLMNIFTSNCNSFFAILDVLQCIFDRISVFVFVFVFLRKDVTLVQLEGFQLQNKWIDDQYTNYRRSRLWEDCDEFRFTHIHVFSLISHGTSNW